MDLIVQAGRYQSPNDGEVEIVEREGRGHFDTICDALADEVSRTLCRASLDRFGEILHHIGNRSGHQRDGCWRSHIQFTIRCAIISRFVAEIALAVSTKHRTREFDVSVNAAHDLEKGEFFLTVIGTSAECGDDGRGNRGSGLITPFRPGVD